MKNVKTYEGFLDFFKRKYSENDKIVLDIIKNLKSKDSESIKIEKGDRGVSNSVENKKHIENESYRVQFDDIEFTIYGSYNKSGEFIGEPTDIPLGKIDSVLSKGSWDDDFQQKLTDEGAVRVHSDLFYKLEIDGNPIICSWDLLKDLFELVVKF